MTEKKVRHIVSLSGGKDSTALAIYLRDRVPDLEYVFCDTEKELPETYEYLDLLEAYLGKPIVRLKHDGRNFEHWLTVYGNYLPSGRSRWCTRHLKIEPFERYIGDDLAYSYMGIRADESYRVGYKLRSSKPNITPVYPFLEDGIDRAEVMRILRDKELGLPAYYRWRSRSGCFFCFFQQKIEWVRLLEHHPDRFAEAQGYEKPSSDGKTKYTWNDGESLEELTRPERIEQIKAEHERRMEAERRRQKRSGLLIDIIVDEDELFCSIMEGYEIGMPCVECR